MLQSVLNNIDRDQELNRDDIISLLALEDEEKLGVLYSLADHYRQKYVGDDVHPRGLIEFSNYCRKYCLYCGIRRGNQNAGRYRMTPDEILDNVKVAEKLGYRTVVLQSGEDLYYTADKLVCLVSKIKQLSDVAVTLSIGERPYEEYLRMYEAGADRFSIRFETSNRELYQKLHPDSNYDDRMNALKWLKEIGYQVGSGVMTGLPGQTLEDLADDILTFRDLELDMVGVGPYICHEDTPLAGNPNGTVEMTYKVVALTRIVTRYANIPATTALATLRQADGRETALQLGANVLMPNVTPVNTALYMNFIRPRSVSVRMPSSAMAVSTGGYSQSGARYYGHSFYSSNNSA